MPGFRATTRMSCQFLQNALKSIGVLFTFTPHLRDARPGKGYRALTSSVAKRRDPPLYGYPQNRRVCTLLGKGVKVSGELLSPCRIPRVFLHGSSVAKNYCTADLRIPAFQMQSRCPWTPVQGPLFTRLRRGAECFSAVAHCDDSGASLWIVAFLGGYAAGRCKGRACSCRVPHTPGGWKGVCCKSERLRSERRARCM